MSSQVDDRPKTNGHVPADSSLRTFRGRSLEEVLPQIRAELGPDAVVVRQRDGLMGGIGGFFQQQFVEVQARPGASRLDLYDDEPALPPSLAPAADTATPPASAPSAPSGPEALGHDQAPAARLTPAELLARATGAKAGDRRTPAEILREHSDTFARQLAAAEERAEPVVRATATAAETPAGTYAPPVPAAADGDPIPLPPRPAPEPAPEPAPDLPPAASAEPAAVADGAAPARADAAAPAARAGAADASAPAAARAGARAAKKRRGGTRAKAARAAPQARPDADAKPAARAESKARGEPGARAAEASEAAAPARAARPAAAASAKPAARAAADSPARTPARRASAKAGPAEPERGGVAPRTTQALELAAAIAANVGAERPSAPAPRAAATAPGADADGAAGDADGAAAQAAAPPAPLPRRPAPAVVTSVSPPRRSLFGRRRRGMTTPREVVDAPVAAAVTGALATRGLAPAAAEQLLVDATANVLPFTPGADVRSAVRGALARRIPIPDPPRPGGRVVAFVGAGGGGKTRCSAGLAAAYARGSSVPVACLALAPADGGAELSALLGPHGVKVEHVADAQAAAQRISALRAEALVVIDTPAVQPGDAAAVDRLAADLDLLQLDEVQLTVPATLSAAVAQELVEALAPLRPTGMTMTHADATGHIGAVVELSCATRLPLAYVNDGLELPGALAPADPVRLAERLLP